MGTLGGWVEAFHPVPIAAVLASAALFTTGAPGERRAAFLIALLLTQLAISLHNAWCDRDLDARTKPWRPIPRGALRPAVALRASQVLVVLGLVAASPLGVVPILLVALGTACGFAYSAGLKRSAWSWLPFSLALPTLLVCASLVGGFFSPWLALAYVVAPPVAVAVNLADQLDDVGRDPADVRGLAQRLGRRRALVGTWVAVAASIVVELLARPDLCPGMSLARRPGPLTVVALAFLGAAVVTRGRPHRVHLALVFVSCIALALDWLSAPRAEY